MTGYYRLALASYVVLFHLAVGFIFAGQIAVFSFFTLSGYLITLVLNDIYKNHIFYFFVNRLIIVLLLGTQDKPINPALVLPSTINEWFSNILIFGLNDKSTLLLPARLLPPAWSLNTELVYYILMGLCLSRSKHATILWFIFSIVLAVSAHELTWGKVYFSFIYPSLAFASGAVLYFIKGSLEKDLGLKLAWFLFMVGLLFPVAPALFNFFFRIDLLSRVGGMVLLYMAPFFACLAIIGANNISSIYPRAARICGDMAYPLFLLHWPIGALVSSLPLSVEYAFVTSSNGLIALTNELNRQAGGVDETTIKHILIDKSQLCKMNDSHIVSSCLIQ